MSDYYKNDEEEYQDWEYPDQDDIEDLEYFGVEDFASQKQYRWSLLIKIFGAIMILSFIGSLFVPLFGLFSSGSGEKGIESQEEVLESIYTENIEKIVIDVLKDNPNGDTISYLNVEFPMSEQDPIVAILINEPEVTGSAILDRVNGYSIDLFRDIFSDIRFRNVTLVWFEASGVETDGEIFAQAFLMIGISKANAMNVNWSSLSVQDLRNISDYYQEYPE